MSRAHNRNFTASNIFPSFTVTNTVFAEDISTRSPDFIDAIHLFSAHANISTLQNLLQDTYPHTFSHIEAVQILSRIGVTHALSLSEISCFLFETLDGKFGYLVYGAAPYINLFTTLHFDSGIGFSKISLQKQHPYFLELIDDQLEQFFLIWQAKKYEQPLFPAETIVTLHPTEPKAQSTPIKAKRAREEPDENTEPSELQRRPQPPAERMINPHTFVLEWRTHLSTQPSQESSTNSLSLYD